MIPSLPAIAFAIALSISSVSIKDIEFIGAVERSIQADHPSGLPAWWKRQINQLGFTSYKIRRAAYERIVKRCVKNPKEVRWVFWGLSHSDLEVRLWCNKVLWTVSECPSCFGTGSHEWTPTGNTFDSGESTGECGGCGHWHRGTTENCKECNGMKRFWAHAVRD